METMLFTIILLGMLALMSIAIVVVLVIAATCDINHGDYNRKHGGR